MPGAEPGRFSRLSANLETMRRMGPLRPGVPRSQITVPISPDGRVDDTVLFEDPADPAKVYYLPRYRLRVTPATGHYEITTSLVDGRWRMTFGLESFAAPEIARADALILPHDLTVSVSSAGELARDYPVAEVTPGFGTTQNRPEVVLLLTLPERDALLRAFLRDEENARLVVHRAITVAVRAAAVRPRPDVIFVAQPDQLGTHVVLPDLVINALPSPIPEQFQPVPIPDPDPDRPDPRPEELERLIERHRDERVVERVDDHVGEAVQLEGQGRQVIRDAVQLNQVNFRQRLAVDRSFQRLLVQPEVPAAPLLRATLRRPDIGVLSDGDGPFSEVFRRRHFPGRFPVPDEPDPVPVPEPEPRFVLVSNTQDIALQLRFDIEAHPYLFPSGQPPATKGFTTLVVPWPADGPSSRNHVYFQDQNAGNVFYFLPDVFLIGQREEAPYGPELSFTVGRSIDAQTNAERALALMGVHLVPQTSPARLFAAAAELAKHIPGGGVAELRPAVHQATCTLDLPGGAITTHAAPDLVRGWWVSESFDFDALRDVYAVLTTSGPGAVLRGRVDVSVDDDKHQVPVELRLDRPAVPPLSWTEKPGADGSITVTLLNVGEVDLAVPVLPAWTDGLPAAVSGALPAKLTAGTTLDLTVTPAQPGGTDVTLDVSGVRVIVDPEKAVSQTLDRRVERLPRVIKLITTAGGLGTSGDPERDLSWIGIQFEGVASAVVIDHTTLQSDVAVPVPLLDWLLNRGLGSFRFRQTLVHVSGRSTQDTDWRSTDSNLLALPQP
ncbi:hypothetical protein ACIA49_35530 [Kribbella sp. NPDC051587]|uniref:hypothetical protein n=1 Tax=Kribbella sp. NPDC051587 TaxID=3364119 RepID=UPI00378DAC2B